MCGIFCSISRRQHVSPSAHVQALLTARGPDAQNKLDITHCNKGEDAKPIFVTCYSTVLSLRGDTTITQPYKCPSSDSALCWNGEAWTLSGERPKGNDTVEVSQLLSVTCDPTKDSANGSHLYSVARSLSHVAGPYAFVYYDEPSGSVYFGRDLLGRRSLLWSVTAEGDILVSSVADSHPGEKWSEVEADGIYCVHLSEHSSLPNSDCEQWGSFAVSKVPYLLADEDSNNTSVLPKLSLNRQAPSQYTRLNEELPSVSALETLLRQSLSLRVSNIPDPLNVDDPIDGLRPARLAILFSGGLDCTMLARLSHNLLTLTEPIDLLNVAFENPRVHKSKTEVPYELCPDRITGRKSYMELKRVCPGRIWRFITIDVPYQETQEHRPEIIKLMHPHNTEMDFSIASALYFAARGRGCIASNQGEGMVPSHCAARVLLSGLGADELFAGYTRHATAFNRHGVEGLLDELDLDIARLGKRNLGRDDRVISHWGREARFPFLDELLVGWALSAPVFDKCDFGAINEGDSNSCSSIEPGKKVLRCLAWKLGMKEVATEKKRAIQFGARTAKMETGKTKGTTLLS